MFRKDARHNYRAIPLDEIPWLEHGFGTRHSAAWPEPWRLATVHQIHSDTVLSVGGAGGCLGAADVLISDQAGCLLGVRTADCLPILLVEERRRVIAAIHAGWRGTALAIASKLVERLCAEFAGDPQYLHAAIGPGIGPCCYEVGPSVARRFQVYFPERSDLDGAVKLDLVEANRRQFAAAGLRQDRIYTGAPCTCCHAEDFYSYRREPGTAARMVSVVGIRP